MREHREPWLKLPAKEPDSSENPRLDSRFRTHVVPVRSPSAPIVQQSPERSRRSSVPREPEFELPLQATGPLQPSAAAIERAATAAAIGTSATIRLGPSNAPPRVARETPSPAPKALEMRPAATPTMGFDDLMQVTSEDWAVKVGEAAKLVDVVVVFYSAAYLGSEMFNFAFRTVVNEVLPQTRRPYTVYRFSLDDEPEFVPEMAASLGLPMDNPITRAGFAWSGPGRRLLLIGDRAMQSQGVFQRSLRRNLTGEVPDQPRATFTRREPAASRDRAYGGVVRPWSGRVLAIVAWCLFGSAALGAVLVGVAPQWASSLLHPVTPRSPAQAPKDPSSSGDAQSRPSPSAASLGNAVLGEAANGSASGTAPITDPVKPARSHSHRRRASSSPSARTYWGLPENDTR